MPRRNSVWIVPLIIAVLAVVFLLTKGPRPPAPNPPGTFSFAVLGDAPYYHHEEMQFRVVLQDLDAHELRFVVHVGDIWWRPCSDAKYLEAREWFRSQRHPVYYTPGDNEWADCWEPRVGGYVPHERLAFLRKLFYDDARVTRQRGYPENMRWRDGDIVFATLHLVGSGNGRRSPADDAEVNARTDASIAWMRETFTEDASAIVLATHANLFEPPEYRAPYESFIAALDAEVARFGRPVVVVNGDDHEYFVDHPLPGRPNFTRMQVPGSPLVGWVRVVVRPGPTPQFTFEERLVPRWKYW